MKRIKTKAAESELVTKANKRILIIKQYELRCQTCLSICCDHDLHTYYKSLGYVSINIAKIQSKCTSLLVNNSPSVFTYYCDRFAVTGSNPIGQNYFLQVTLIVYASYNSYLLPKYLS